MIHDNDDSEDERQQLLNRIRSGDIVAFRRASEQMRGDPDIVMEALRHGRPQTFQFVAHNLQADHAFIAQAVRVTNGQILAYASNDMCDDLRTAADLFGDLRRTQWVLTVSHQRRDAFMEFMCCVTKSATKNPVTLLNLDAETKQNIAQIIAEYAGVPFGPSLAPVRLAKRTLPIFEALAVHIPGANGNLQGMLRIVVVNTMYQVIHGFLGEDRGELRVIQ